MKHLRRKKMIDVSNLRIYELRDYARKIGVKSPTTKVKKQLISEINLINSNQLKPHKTTKGRKPIISFALGEKNQKFIFDEIEKTKKNIIKQLDAFLEKILQRKL